MLLTFVLDSMWMSQPKRRSQHFSFALVLHVLKNRVGECVVIQVGD